MSNPIYTPGQFLAEMNKLKQEFGEDPETAHACMDDLMCELLISLGYHEGVQVFIDQPKWYA